MCCGFTVKADGLLVLMSGLVPPKDSLPSEVAVFGGRGDHRPNPETWIYAMKQAASTYYRAVEYNPDKHVILTEIGDPCKTRILAETKPHDEVGQFDPTRTCGWVRRHINLSAMKAGGLSDAEIRRGATKPLSDYRKPRTRKRQVAK